MVKSIILVFWLHDKHDLDITRLMYEEGTQGWKIWKKHLLSHGSWRYKKFTDIFLHVMSATSQCSQYTDDLSLNVKQGFSQVQISKSYQQRNCHRFGISKVYNTSLFVICMHLKLILALCIFCLLAFGPTQLD